MGWLLGLFGGSSLGLWIVGGVLALGAGGVGVQTWRLHSLEADYAEARVAWAQRDAAAAQAAAAQTAAFRAKEQAWAKSHEEIINVAIQKTEAAASAVVAADAASERLSKRFAALARASGSASGRAAAAGPGPAASSPADLLAYVQRRISEAAGGVGKFADDANIAGDACVSSYQTLRK